MAKPIAATVSDLHLSHNVPVARAETRREWYRRMAYYIQELNRITGGLTLLLAGDIVHTWHEPHELTNFLIGEMWRREAGYTIAIPGQHDLPNHVLKEVHRSAYWTLVKAKVITHIDISSKKDHCFALGNGWIVYGFPWSVPVRDVNGEHNIALIHDYLWRSGRSYPGAPKEKHIDQWWPRLKSFDVAIFGDNHRSFGAYKYNLRRTTLHNGGTFMRRRADERQHKPSVGIIYGDGTVKREYLDTSGDKWRDEANDIAEANLANVDLHEVADMLKKLSAQTDDYIDALTRLALEQKDPKMRATMLRIAEESNG